MTDRKNLVDLLEASTYEALGGNLVVKGFATAKEFADHLIANGVTVQETAKKAEDCRCFTKTNYGGGCLGTREIDPCKGDGCENWKPKEERPLANNMIDIPRCWFPDGEKLRASHKSKDVIALYDVSDPLNPVERYVIYSTKEVYEAAALHKRIESLHYMLEDAMLEKDELEKKLHANTAKGGPVAEVSRAGVCELCGDGAELIKVNGHCLVSEMEKAVEQLNPDCDHRGAFAARVTISVELLGDTLKLLGDIEEGSE